MDAAQMEKVADTWSPGMGIRERARSIGIVGRALTPDEWSFCAQECDEATTHLPARWESAEVQRISDGWAERIAHFEERAELARIHYEQAMTAHVSRAMGSYRGPRLQSGEALPVGIPVSGDAMRARTTLEMALADLAAERAARDAAVMAQYARESVTPLPTEKRGRRK